MPALHFYAKPITCRQQGQALVLALMLLVMGASSLYFLFKAGRLVQEKTKLTDTADAVAYSAALAQARAFNFMAMINRANIANSVAMAHLVTYASWAQYGDTLGERARRRYPPVSLIVFGFPLQGPGYAASPVMLGQGAAWAGDTDGAGAGLLQNAFEAHDALVHDRLRVAQKAVLDNLIDNRGNLMQSVVEHNYAGATPAIIDPQLLSDTLKDFKGQALLRDYQGDERTRLRALVTDAVNADPFIPSRNGDATSLTIAPPPPCLAMGMLYKLKRRGSTTLLEFDRWEAVDTQSFHIPVKRRFIGCRYRENRMGSGNVLATNSNAFDFDEANDDTENEPSALNPDTISGAVQTALPTQSWSAGVAASQAANPLATQYALAQRVSWSFRGLPGFVDLNTQALSTLRPTARIVFRLLKPQADTEKSQVQPAGRLARYQPDLPGGVLAAIGAAETYFERPDERSDGQHELPSLFHPYWLARLVPALPTERDEALRRQGS